MINYTGQRYSIGVIGVDGVAVTVGVGRCDLNEPFNIVNGVVVNVYIRLHSVIQLNVSVCGKKVGLFHVNFTRA